MKPLRPPLTPEPATEEDDGFALETQAEPEPQASSSRKSKPAMQAGSRTKAGEEAQILSYRHPNKRKNNPEVGMVKPENDPEQPKTAWAYDPHLDPALQFDVGRAAIEKLIDDALASAVAFSRALNAACFNALSFACCSSRSAQCSP